MLLLPRRLVGVILPVDILTLSPTAERLGPLLYFPLFLVLAALPNCQTFGSDSYPF
jgi:hypothetical protein